MLFANFIILYYFDGIERNVINKVKRQYRDLYSEYKAAQKATGLFARRNEEKALDVANRFYDDNRSELFQLTKPSNI